MGGVKRPRDDVAAPQTNAVKDARVDHAADLPYSVMGRAFQFGSLGVGLLKGTLDELIARQFQGRRSGAAVWTPANAERIAQTLRQLRGAALKLGQILSLLDDVEMVPPELTEVLQRTRNEAYSMPRSQLEVALCDNLGSRWEDNFGSFDASPIASASIGQVHRATTKKGGLDVAVKIQYPGVADSIDADMSNLQTLLALTGALPSDVLNGNIISNAKRVLHMECDYCHEAEMMKRYKAAIGGDSEFIVPKVCDELSDRRVLTTQFLPGVPVDQASSLTQSVRDSIARRILCLFLRELFEFRFMQTDPNWTNFLYDEASDTIGLVDFGATKDFTEEFSSGYLSLLYGCVTNNKEQIISASLKLKLIQPNDTAEVLDAHVAYHLGVNEPFRSNQPYDFSASRIAQRMGPLAQKRLQVVKKAPPQEMTLAHKKLLGCYLLFAKLHAVVPCRDLFLEVYQSHQPMPA